MNYDSPGQDMRDRERALREKARHDPDLRERIERVEMGRVVNVEQPETWIATVALRLQTANNRLANVRSALSQVLDRTSGNGQPPESIEVRPYGNSKTAEVPTTMDVMRADQNLQDDLLEQIEVLVGRLKEVL